MIRPKLNIQGSIFNLPIGPADFNAQISFDHSRSTPFGDATVFYAYEDSRMRVMTWRNLPNKYPYDFLVSGLRSAVGISGVKILYGDLQFPIHVANAYYDIFVEDCRVTYRKGLGPSSARHNLRFDIDFIFSTR